MNTRMTTMHFYSHPRHRCCTSGSAGCALGVALAVCLALICTPGSVRAQPEDTAPRILARECVAPLSLDLAIELALARSPELTDLRARVALARQQRRADLAIRNPELRLSYDVAKTETEKRGLLAFGTPLPDGTYLITHYENRLIKAKTGTGEAFQAAIRFYPPNPFIMNASARSAAAEIEIAYAELQAAEATVNDDVKRLFAEVHYRREDVGFLRQLAAIRKSLHELEKQRAARRLATSTDVAAAARRYLTAFLNRKEGERALAAARELLATHVGRNTTDLNTLGPQPELPAAEISQVDEGGLVHLALCHRPDLAALAWRYHAARARLRRHRAGYVPWFTHVQGGYSRNTATDEQNPAWKTADGRRYADPSPSVNFDEDLSSEWRIDLAIEIPIFAALQSSGRAHVDECALRTTQLLESEDRAAAEVRNALASLRAAVRDADETRENTQTYVEDIRKALEKTRNRMDVDPEDVSRMNETLVRIERGAAESKFEARNSLLRLERAVGLDLNNILALAHCFNKAQIEAPADIMPPAHYEPEFDFAP